MQGPTEWPLTVTPERSTATQSNIVCLWCSLVTPFKRCPRTESRVRVTLRNTAVPQLTLYPAALHIITVTIKSTCNVQC